ncbi:MAG: NAD-dependent epimerase/dehydratase family protein [Chitinophagaceae bacterium]
MFFRIILTGATGMVGEGVLLECLSHPSVSKVLMVNRRSSAIKHPKLTECIVPDFFQLDHATEQLSGYDACFYCAGISSAGMNEADYSRITYDTTLHFAKTLLSLNPSMTFNHISGSGTNSRSRFMWARVKGKAEDALLALPFKTAYNFRPGFMKPTAGQQNVKGFYKILNVLTPLLKLIFPGKVCSMKEVGLAMINSLRKGYPKNILEVNDIRKLAALSGSRSK